jgi:rRNA small subunit pseudouridine methyltransferase Nep1
MSNNEAKTDSPSLVPQAPKVLSSKDKNTKRLIVVLSNACLETHKISSSGGDRYALLNCDDHQALLKKMNRDIADTRPDITHQVSFMLLDG